MSLKFPTLINCVQLVSSLTVYISGSELESMGQSCCTTDANDAAFTTQDTEPDASTRERNRMKRISDDDYDSDEHPAYGVN